MMSRKVIAAFVTPFISGGIYLKVLSIDRSPAGNKNKRNGPKRATSRGFCCVRPIITLVIFVHIAAFNPFPSLPSVAADDRKQFQGPKIFFML